MSLLTLSNNNISMIMKFKYYINDYEVIQRWRCFWPSGGIAICIILIVILRLEPLVRGPPPVGVNFSDRW